MVNIARVHLFCLPAKLEPFFERENHPEESAILRERVRKKPGEGGDADDRRRFSCGGGGSVDI